MRKLLFASAAALALAVSSVALSQGGGGGRGPGGGGGRGPGGGGMRWVRPVAVCLTVRPAVADSCAVPAAQGISAHRVAVAERRASLARLAAAVAVGSLVLSVDYGLALVLVRVAVLLSVRRMARRQVRASAVRPCISLVVGCGSSITATSTFLCRLLARGFGVTILAGGTPLGGGSTATTADTRP
jgi:hypothetical protein